VVVPFPLGTLRPLLSLRISLLLGEKLESLAGVEETIGQVSDCAFWIRHSASVVRVRATVDG
jgi:hypothetical protein